MNTAVKQVVVLSTKGGAGKTMVSSALSVLMNHDLPLIALDADVDAPNLGLLLQCKITETRPLIASQKASINYDSCTSCGVCIEHCPEDALFFDDEEVLQLHYHLCEGCGVCEFVCPEDAISISPAESGFLKIGESKYGFPCVTGELKIGEGSSGKIVTEAKQTTLKLAREQARKVVIIDGPPGSSCNAIASVTGASYAVLVTEPTPAALSDVKRAIQLVQQFNIPYGIIINKASLIPEFIDTIKKEVGGEKIIGIIPYDTAVPHAIAELTPIPEYSPTSETSLVLKKITEIVKQKIFEE